MQDNQVANSRAVRSQSNPDAEFLPEITHLEAIERGLKVMDTTALSLCMDNKLPIYVFGLETGNIGRVVAGERVGTIISTPGMNHGITNRAVLALGGYTGLQSYFPRRLKNPRLKNHSSLISAEKSALTLIVLAPELNAPLDGVTDNHGDSEAVV